MSEKVRALNLTSANVLAASTTSSSSDRASLAALASGGGGGGGGGCALIGAPTLISSTFNTNTSSLTPTSTALSMAHSLCSSSLASGDANDIYASSSIDEQHHQQQQQDVHSDYTTSGNGGGGGTPNPITAQLSFHLVPLTLAAADGCSDANSIMNSSQISTTSNDSANGGGGSGSVSGGGGVITPLASAANIITHHKPTVTGSGGGKPLTVHSVAGKNCRFPKLEECAHFHYERVQLGGTLAVHLVDDKTELLNSSIASQSLGGDIDSSQTSVSGAPGGFGLGLSASSASAGPSSFRSFSPSNCWFIVKVCSKHCDPFLVKRSFDNMQMLDEMLHRCVYDRKISRLQHLQELDFKSDEDVEYAVATYLDRFSKIASDSLTCGTILTWLQLDNKGRRLPLADTDTMRSINTPAVGAAYGVRRYQAQAPDEISIEVGDMISVIDMPSPAESSWWRGKKSHQTKSHYEVGFFPQSCVATIGDKVPRNFPMPAPLVGQLEMTPTKPVLRKHGKLIAFFRSFILSRPSRRRLKQSGIYRERVFSCDLSEHLLNSGQDIPMVLSCCADFIERYGIIDGIYRLSGITSNIQKLRRAFDEERVPDLGNPEMKQDIHAVSSLLKMYFRELPNPLCTYQLYDNFVEAIQEKSESSERLRLMKATVLKLPPPHYRTLKYLAGHLHKISQHSERTGMTDKNLAIVWAPNLLRSPALESGGVAALRGVGVQAVVTEYLIRNCHHIFDALDDPNARLSSYIVSGGGGQGQSTVSVTTEGANRLDSLTDCESLLVEQREHDQSLTAMIGSSYTERPKSLSGGGGSKLISLEEAQERHSRLDNYDIKQSMPISMAASTNAANIGSYIEVGGGPSSLPDKYHTVLSMPRSMQKRKTHSWKSLFTRNPQQQEHHKQQQQQQQQRNVDNEARKYHRASHNDAGNGTSVNRKENAQVTFADAHAKLKAVGIGSGAGGSSGGGDGKLMSGKLLTAEKTKSIERFDTASMMRGDLGIGKPMDICVRSNSIDSLRTAGHSRSVSHDSYFDLLQSPQRAGHITSCPSRELSELGLNFDREEPEMRIFSESESLVSSPRVGKENIPPASGAATRRILRARPEEFSSQTNSVNPSPKKQPRLNLLLSPCAAAAAAAGHNAHQQQQHLSAEQRWSQSSSVVDSGHVGVGVIDVEVCCQHNHAQLSSDESCCKRYKLEDQLSDIQFIDCGTPEHAVAAGGGVGGVGNGTALYTNVQIHAPPKSACSTLSKNSLYGSLELPPTAKPSSSHEPKELSAAAACNVDNNTTTATRYSYPTVQLGAKRKEQETKERFSYPGVSVTSSKMHVEQQLTNGGEAATKATPLQQQQIPKALPPELLRAKQRSSYCGGAHEPLNALLLRSNSSDKCDMDLRGTKYSITPSSPMQSPRYSLLVGDATSSENSSAINTPQYELDPLMVASAMSGMSGLSATSSTNAPLAQHHHQLQQQQQLLNVDAASSSYLGTSHESLGSNLTTSHSPRSHQPLEQRDMQALRRELSLDLQPVGAAGHSGSSAGSSMRMYIEQAEIGSGGSHVAGAGRQRHGAALPPPTALASSPNNSNFTDNTSQSVTPSEFGYQHLQRPSSMHSLIQTTTENSPIGGGYPDDLYDEYEHDTPSQLLAGGVSPTKSAGGSPIKATISITYNMRSPREEYAAAAPKPPLLETSFDEHTVYEQVRSFRNSVTEVNQLLHASSEPGDGEQKLAALCEETHTDSDDGLGLADAQRERLESAEAELEEKLLYENVELRKPKSVYANMLGEQMKGTAAPPPTPPLAPAAVAPVPVAKTSPVKACASADDVLGVPFGSAARRSPSNFSVKELANKFESSPVEQAAVFDFSVRSSIKKQSDKPKSPKSPCSETTPPAHSPPSAGRPKLAATASKATAAASQQQQITRSLDENAFVREFGGKQLQQFHMAARSQQQLPDMHDATAPGISNRRKSFDFTRPKTLNPPKRLPGMPIAEEHFDGTVSIARHRQQHCNSAAHISAAAHAALLQQGNDDYHYDACGSSLENDCESSELRITPTTENRISLIQHNVTPTAAGAVATPTPPATAADAHNSNTNSLKMLSGVKLDRERIDKIKEERRQQLTQKYRGSGSINDCSNVGHKSKSKTDLLAGRDDEEAAMAEGAAEPAASLRVKSKSRGDMRIATSARDNNEMNLLKMEFGRAGSVASGINASAAADTTTPTALYAPRVRSISDEKNQNCDTAAQTPSSSSSTAAATNSNIDALEAKPQQQQQQQMTTRATAMQKFERGGGTAAVGTGGLAARRSVGAATAAGGNAAANASGLDVSNARHSTNSTREKISPQFSIRNMAAMFESRSQNQQ